MPSPGDLADWAERIQLPAQAAMRHAEMLTSLEEQACWLDELATRSPRRAALAVQRQLAFLVRDPRPPAVLPQLLRAFHVPIAALQQRGQDILASSPERPSRQQEGLIEVLPGLFEELALAHTRVVRLSLEQGRRPPAPDLHAAMLMSLRLLEWSLLQYRQNRPNLWRQIIRLYDVTTAFRLGAAFPETPLRTAADPAGTRDTFVAALLLLLIDSYRYPPSGVVALIGMLPELAAELHLYRERPGKAAIPLLLQEEVPPLDFVRRPRGRAPDHYLGVDRLLARLRRLWSSKQVQQTARRLEQDLLGLLEGRRDRCHPREVRAAEYLCVQGLEAVHERLLQLQLSEGLAPLPDTADDTARNRRFACRQNDISAGGASFILGPDTPCPEPDAWLLFEALDSPGSGFVARLRRRLVDDNGYQYIGVERVSGQLIPVTLGTHRRPGLLWAQPRQGRYSLIAPDGHYLGHGHEEILTGTHRDYRVRHEQRVGRQGNSEIIALRLLD